MAIEDKTPLTTLKSKGRTDKPKEIGHVVLDKELFPASLLVGHPLLIPENAETMEQMEEEHCPCIWLTALKGHF